MNNNSSYYSYQSNNAIACEGEPYEISDCQTQNNTYAFYN